MKKNLQEVTDFKVMNIKECLDALEWNYEDNEESDTYDNISCPCGGELEFSGFLGTEVIKCNKCGKRMIDLFSPIQTGNSTATILDFNQFEITENRHWIADNKNGGIKII